MKLRRAVLLEVYHTQRKNAINQSDLSWCTVFRGGYPADVTVKIDGIAASAASVIAMAGTTVLMAPTALMMIHNPMTMAFGDHEDMQKANGLWYEVQRDYYIPCSVLEEEDKQFNYCFFSLYGIPKV